MSSVTERSNAWDLQSFLEHFARLGLWSAADVEMGGGGAEGDGAAVAEDRLGDGDVDDADAEQRSLVISTSLGCKVDGRSGGCFTVSGRVPMKEGCSPSPAPGIASGIGDGRRSRKIRAPGWRRRCAPAPPPINERDKGAGFEFDRVEAACGGRRRSADGAIGQHGDARPGRDEGACFLSGAFGVVPIDAVAVIDGVSGLCRRYRGNARRDGSRGSGARPSRRSVPQSHGAEGEAQRDGARWRRAACGRTGYGRRPEGASAFGRERLRQGDGDHWPT